MQTSNSILQGYISKDEVMQKENPTLESNNTLHPSYTVTPEVMLPAYFDLGLMPDLDKEEKFSSIFIN